MSRTGPRQGRRIKHVRNPSDSIQEAEEMVRKFHGREPRDIIEFNESEKYPETLAVLGQLMELTILKDSGNSVVPIRFCKLGADGKPKADLEDMVQVCCTEKGRPIYFKGGDQELDLAGLEKVGLGKFGMYQDGELCVIGPVMSIVYWTDKHHLEGPKYQTKGAQYEHELGEMADKGEYGEMPMLVYDTLNKRMFFAGGSYEVRENGIWN